jgi:hypothetical protein
MKKIAILALMLISSVITYADNVLSAKDITIAAGEKATVSVSLDNSSETISGIVFKMTLPSWLEVVSGSAVFDKSRTNDEGKPDFAVTKQEDNVYQIFYNSSEQWTYYITGNSGSLFSFQLQIKEDATVEDGTTASIKFSDFECFDIEFNDLNSTLSFADINVTVGAAAAETEKITLTKEYNTYIPAKALDFSSVEGIKAYYVTAVTATEATITEATTVAAGEGIIISGTPGDYEVPVATVEVAPSEENLLKTSGIAVNDYILYNGKFVLCSDGELADGKAYLPANAFTAGAKIINIVFGGESTGINEVQKSETDGAIYNLSGMRVSKTQKGVYIMNGRKVIVK